MKPLILDAQTIDWHWLRASKMALLTAARHPAEARKVDFERLGLFLHRLLDEYRDQVEHEDE